MDEEAYIASITKGKLSVAEALKEIESVKLAFSKAERIEQKLHYHDSWLQDIKTSISTLTTQEYVNLKFSEISSRLDQQIKKNFEEFVSQYQHQLNEKVSYKDLDTAMSQKVTWLAFNNFAQQMSAVKSRVEKHIMSDFEGLKTKMKIELSKKANEKKPEEEFAYEEIIQLKNRLTSLEQKYHDMFVEEGLDESEDYDSQEEMDNIMDDIDRTAHRERGDSDEAADQDEDEQIRQIVAATPTTANSDPVKVFTSASISPENQTQEEEKKETKATVNSPDFSPRELLSKCASSEKAELKESGNGNGNGSGSGALAQGGLAMGVQRDGGGIGNAGVTPKVPEAPIVKLDPPSQPSPPILPNLSEVQSPPAPAPVPAPVSAPSQPLPSPPNIESSDSRPKPVPKIIIPDQPVTEDSGKTPSRAKLEMENLDPQSRYARTKGASSRNDNQTLSRKNSMVSSRSGTNAGGGPSNMRNINKKLTGLQKELESYKQALDESKQTLLAYQEELAKAYDRIGQVRLECQEVEGKRQAMEMSFIKALRRNGIERKQKAKSVAVSGINAKQMNEIKQQIEDKAKKIVTVSSYVEKIAADTQVMKESQKNKINEVIQYMKYLDESRQQLNKEFVNMVSSLKAMESDIKGSVNGIKGEVAALQGPIVDLVSEQQRENLMLNEDIKTQQSLIYELVESKKGNLTPVSRGIRTRVDSNPTTAPDLSLKYKLVSSKHGNRRTSAKTVDNWLEIIPDGNPLVLPRIIGSSPQRNKRML